MSLTRQNVFRIWSLPTVGPMAKDRLLNSLWILWSSLVSNALGNVAKNGTFFNCCLTNSVSYLLQWHFQIFWCGYCINDKIMLYFCCVTQCFSLSLITHKLKFVVIAMLLLRALINNFSKRYLLTSPCMCSCLVPQPYIAAEKILWRSHPLWWKVQRPCWCFGSKAVVSFPLGATGIRTGTPKFSRFFPEKHGVYFEAKLMKKALPNNWNQIHDLVEVYKSA